MSDQKVRTDRSPLWRISFSAGHSFSMASIVSASTRKTKLLIEDSFLATTFLPSFFID